MKTKTFFAVAGAIALVTAAFLKRKAIADFFKKNIRIVESEGNGVDYHYTPEDEEDGADVAENDSNKEVPPETLTTNTEKVEKSAALSEKASSETFTVFRDESGLLGVKKGEEIVISPKQNYKDIKIVQGVIIITDSGGNDRLVTATETLRFPCGGIKEHDNYLVGRRKGVNWIYVPSNKTLCKAHAFAVSSVGDVITHYKGHINIYKGGECVIKGSNYRRVAILPDGHLLVFKEKFWEKAHVKDGAIISQGMVSTKEIKGWKNSCGWSDDAPVMILK